jgi:hypothetical protein
MTPFVVFNATTGEALRWGNCQPELVEAQAGAGESALATSALTVEGNKFPIWESVRTLRAAKINGGSPTPFGIADSDDESRSNISGAVIAALVAKSAQASYSIVWTLADNSTVTLNADQMIGLGLAVMQHVNACHTNARTLRDLIEDAADMAELLAIDINSGWPV